MRASTYLVPGVVMILCSCGGQAADVRATAAAGLSAAVNEFVRDGEDESPRCDEFETCGNGVDDDCDGATDCDDAACHEDCRTVCVPDEFGEQCGNGSDDDCDGRVDCADTECNEEPACTQRCEPTEGNNCNGDPGYGDRCAPADNENGCSAERFDAWCNRRNPEREGAWDAYIAGWVDARCDGEVNLEDAQYPDYYCTDSSGVDWRCRTPLVIKLDASRSVSYARYDGMSAFDFSAEQDGRGTAHDWPTAQTPWLVMDVDGNGRIDSGRELFGSATLVQGVAARDGFQALAALDANGDGLVDGRDPAFVALRAWSDNGDRVSTASELVTLATLGIRALPVQAHKDVACDGRGNCEVERAALAWTDPSGRVRRGQLVDIHLRQQSAPMLACAP